MALAAQDSNGWDNFFEGRLAQDWEQAQTAHYKWCRSRKSGRRWTIAIIQKLWDIAWDLWENRNDMIYAKENAEILHGIMAEVDDAIRIKFQWGPHGLLQRDHGLFTGSVENILTTSIVYQQRWLQRVETARERATRRQLTTYNAERQAIAAWLHGRAAHIE
jgi:hypothetical protein